MQVISPNDVKIYNLSAGKSLPEWISDRKKRAMLKKDTELRERIELIQDFDMPIVSNQVQVSKDNQHIFVTGVYKPRVKCFDVTQLSMKFERCFDSECVKFKILSEDYSKVVFLHNDRYIEFHAQYGKYYKTRIPKFGNDFDYLHSTCDLYFAGTSNEIFRLNLEEGRFLTSLQTQSPENLCCQFNPVHELFTCGGKNGMVECWDPRVQKRVGLLDCKLDAYLETDEIKSNCSITSLKYRDALNLAVGTSTGHILLYDIRSNQPVFIKDHRYELPIKDIEWHNSDNILSMDKRVCKIWNRHTGKPFTSIETGTALNNLCVVPDSGMLFMANEAPKVLVYYIPSLGPAPKWCSFLDNLTEELETNSSGNVYDDYQFLTKQELENLGLSHLIGTNLLRAYMHGYFADIRLYKKAKEISEPVNYDDFKKAKIKEKLDNERISRVSVASRLPKVNKQLAKKILEETREKKIKSKTNIMDDNRFSALFKNPEFQIDQDSEEYRLLNPVVQKMNERSTVTLATKFDKVKDDEEAEGVPSSEEESSDEDDNRRGNRNRRRNESSSSDDEHKWSVEVKQRYSEIQKEKKLKEKTNKFKNNIENKKQTTKQPKFYELKDDLEYFSKNDDIIKSAELKKLPIEERMKKLNANGGSYFDDNNNETVIVRDDSVGNKQMTFLPKKNERVKEYEKKAEEHHLERKKLRRSANEITKTFKRPNINQKFFKKKSK